MANTDSNIDISLLSHAELREAAESGVLGAQLGLLEDAAPTAEWIANNKCNKSLAWGEQYRAVVLHCYHSFLSSQADGLEQLLSAQDA